MIKSLQNIFSIPELRRRILFTLGMLVVYRIGGHIPVPGIDAQALRSFFEQASGTLFGLMDLFAGGNMANATIFALGIMPYISASIILQLLGAVIPYFEKLQKEGEEGRKKITQYTRYGTVGLSLVQGAGVSVWLVNMGFVPNPTFMHHFVSVLTLTAGTTFIMWLGEQITDRGIGNGISLIIFIGIVAAMPGAIINTFRSVSAGTLSIFEIIILGILMLGITASIVLITQGQRRVPVQYPQRIKGRKMYRGQSSHIPLRVNAAGVIPIIFAQSIIMFPGTIAAFMTDTPVGNLAEIIQAWFSPDHWFYSISYGLMVVFFTYFYTAIIFNPVDVADNLKKYGGYVPGVRPGKRTADYIDRILTRVTLPGSIFLALIAVVPYWFIYWMDVPFYFGGTGLLIIVGVALDTLQQIEAHLVMRHYDGLMKTGKLRGRR